MNRRDFISSTSSGATAVAATVTAATMTAALVPNAAGAAATSTTGTREFYELRRIHLRRGPKQKLFDDYLKEAYLPALGRQGIGPVGVFNVMIGAESPSVWLLIPFKSMEDFAGLSGKLRADEEYKKAGAEVRGAPASDPAYVRNESWLLGSIASVPKLEVPTQTREGKGRIFELRTYESHSKGANWKKIEMFDVGETALFRKAGLAPVFFGETLIGSRIPNLTYMLVFDDLAARDKAWRSFAGDPEWKKLSSTPGFTDPEIVTDISNQILRPAAYSQI
jgi:hypothetical protein